MNPPDSLTGPYRHTHEAIFRHPAAHNLAWHDVHALLRHLGQMEQEPNGNLKVSRHGQTLVLHPPRTKEVADTDELMALRHFLQRSETAPVAPAANAAPWLLVINHHEARLFRSIAPGAVAQLFRPHAPEDFFRHAPGSKDFSRGQEKPEPNDFFEPVAAVLHGAAAILIFGGGTGTGSEMEQFAAWLKQHRTELAARIIGTVPVDESHLTEDQLLARARDFQPDAASS